MVDGDDNDDRGRGRRRERCKEQLLEKRKLNNKSGGPVQKIQNTLHRGSLTYHGDLFLRCVVTRFLV